MKLFKAFFILILVISCKKQQELINIPECLLSEQEMIDVMVDVVLVKSAKSTGRQGLKDSGIKPLEYLYNKHGVDTIVIRENLEYYNADLKKSKLLYMEVASKVKERIEVLKVILDSIAAKESKADQVEEAEDLNDD